MPFIFPQPVHFYLPVKNVIRVLLGLEFFFLTQGGFLNKTPSSSVFVGLSIYLL